MDVGIAFNENYGKEIITFKLQHLPSHKGNRYQNTKPPTMSISEFISNQPAERQELLSSLHELIIQNDKTVTPVIGAMMGKEMILYNAPGTFKYGLASVKNHMSLHVLPMYGSPVVYDKYKALLNKAAFQKGCINFKTKEEMPLNIVKSLIADCSKIDLRALREEYLKSKKKKA